MEYEWLAVYDNHKALPQWNDVIIPAGQWKFDEPITVQGIARFAYPVSDEKSGYLREPLEQNKDFIVEISEDKKSSKITLHSQAKMKPERIKVSRTEQDLRIVSENRIASIERPAVKSIALLKRNTDVPLDKRFVGLICHIPQGAKFILYKRIYRKMDAKTGVEVGEPLVVWCVGCQSNIRGQNSQYVNMLWPDGRVETVDRFIDNHPYFHPRGSHDDQGKFTAHVHADEGEEWDFKW